MNVSTGMSEYGYFMPTKFVLYGLITSQFMEERSIEVYFIIINFEWGFRYQTKYFATLGRHLISAKASHVAGCSTF